MSFLAESGRASALDVICWSGKSFDFHHNCFEPIIDVQWGTTAVQCVPCWKCESDMFDLFPEFHNGALRRCHPFCPVCHSIHYHLQKVDPMIWESDRDISASMVLGRRVFLEPRSCWIMELGSSVNSFQMTYNDGLHVEKHLPTPIVMCVANSLLQDGFVPIYTPITILVDSCSRVVHGSKPCACTAAVMLWQHQSTMLSHISLCEYTADWIRVGGESGNPQVDQSVAELCGVIHALHLILEHHSCYDSTIYTDRSAWFTTLLALDQGGTLTLANADGNFTALFVMLLLTHEILFSPHANPAMTITFKAVGCDTIGVHTKRKSKVNNRWCPINVDHWSHLMKNCPEFWEPRSAEHTADLSLCTVKSSADCKKLMQSLAIHGKVDRRYNVCNHVISITFARATQV